MKDDDVNSHENESNEENSSQINETVLNCDLCQKQVPKDNYELHRLRCSRNIVSESTHEKQQPQKSAKTKTKPTKQSKDLIRDTSTDDFDELINLATKMNNVCNLKGCKTKIHVLGQDCDFCGNRFCLSHHMAEIHGCGDAIRAKAKKNSIKVSC